MKKFIVKILLFFIILNYQPFFVKGYNSRADCKQNAFHKAIECRKNALTKKQRLACNDTKIKDEKKCDKKYGDVIDNINHTNSYTPPANTQGTLKINTKDMLKQYQSARETAGKCKTGIIGYDGLCKDEVGSGKGYSSFIGMLNRIIAWMVKISLIIAAAVGVYGGFLYLSSAAEPGKRQQANKLFVNIVIGLILVFAAWFIVKLILDFFAVQGSGGMFSGLLE